MTVADILKRALMDSEKSLRAISRETGIPQPCLSRFCQGVRSMSLENAQTLLDYFGIQVSPPAKAKGRK